MSFLMYKLQNMQPRPNVILHYKATRNALVPTSPNSISDISKRVVTPDLTPYWSTALVHQRSGGVAESEDPGNTPTIVNHY